MLRRRALSQHGVPVHHVDRVSHPIVLVPLKLALRAPRHAGAPLHLSDGRHVALIRRAQKMNAWASPHRDVCGPWKTIFGFRQEMMEAGICDKIAQAILEGYGFPPPQRTQG